MSRLVQMPGGNWINPELVATVEAAERYKWHAGPCVIISRIAGDDGKDGVKPMVMVMPFGTLEGAEAARDAFAAAVNGGP